MANKEREGEMSTLQRVRSGLGSILCLCLLGVSMAQAEFENLLASPYPTQHVNPRNSDFTPYDAPTTNLKVKWKALEDSQILQACSSGSNGLLYCVRGWALADDKCNLIALNEETGARVWEDRIDGQCQLDEQVTVNNPVIDAAGNLYLADSQQVMSFTADGQVRWRNNFPSTVKSRKSLPNVPFGLILLEGGELATATLGDGIMTMFDSQTGEMTRTPFDLPAEKRKPPKPSRFLLPKQMPDDFMDNLTDLAAAQIIWDFSLGESDFEVDNNLAVDEKRKLIFISSGAKFPNKKNSGALWAVSYADKDLSVAWYVELDVPGGIATSPTLSNDGAFVIIGDNDLNLVTVDVQACSDWAAQQQRPQAGQPSCPQLHKHKVDNDITSSVVLTPDNRILVPYGRSSFAAFDLVRDAAGVPTLSKVWETRLGYTPMAMSVSLGFNNVVWIPAYSILWQDSFIVALDIETGEELARYDSGDAANVTLAGDGQTLIANNLSFISSLFLGNGQKGGVWAWQKTARIP